MKTKRTKAKENAKAAPEPAFLPLPAKVNLLVNVFTYDETMGARVAAYIQSIPPSVASHPRVDAVVSSYTHGYPTSRCRNAACKRAKQDGFHYLLMLDDDMWPDLLVGSDPGAKPFLPTALNHALNFGRPCIVAAPYCGGPPEQRVMVMKNVCYAPDLPDGMGFKLSSYTRDEAAVQVGIQQVSALPTGVMLVDLRVLDIVPPPWFAYEYSDAPFDSELASTEDVVFTRNADWLQIPQFVAWDSWAGHCKRYVTGKPRLSPVDNIPLSIHRAYERGWRPTMTFNGEPITATQ